MRDLLYDNEFLGKLFSLKNSEMKKTLFSIENNKKPVFLYGWNEKYRNHILNVYSRQHLAYIDEEDVLINPCLLLRLDKNINSMEELIDLFCNALFFKIPMQMQEDEERFEYVKSIIKNLKVKKILFENSDLLFSNRHEDVFESDVLKLRILNAVFSFYHELEINLVFSGFNTTYDLLDGDYITKENKNRKIPFTIVNQKSKYLEDINLVFLYLEKNKIIFEQSDFYKLREFSIEKRLIINELIVLLEKVIEIAVLSATEYISLKMFENCFNEFISKNRNELKYSQFITE